MSLDLVEQELKKFGLTLDRNEFQLHTAARSTYVQRDREPGLSLRPIHGEHELYELCVDETEPILQIPAFEPNRVHATIQSIDKRINYAVSGDQPAVLREWGPDGQSRAITTRVSSGRCLLIVHGTFSSSDVLVGALVRNARELLVAGYAKVLLFDYQTLSRAAIANGAALSRLVDSYLGPDVEIDVLSHSQGGLVVRYWLELFARERLPHCRSVFVAGTLMGTSLAAPPRLRAALNYFGVWAQVLGRAGEALTGFGPFGAIAWLASILHKSVGLFSTASDAGIALVPGLAGISSVSTNAELDELCRIAASRGSPPDAYFAVTSAYEPSGKFGVLGNLIRSAADHAADRLFPNEHDLVVDTDHMRAIALRNELVIANERCLALGGQDGVSHTEYFSSPRVLEFLGQVFRT